jgi:hypothetical protein
MSEPAEIVTRLAADVCVRRGDDPRDDADMANARDDAAAVLRSLRDQGFDLDLEPVPAVLTALIEEAERG